MRTCSHGSLDPTGRGCSACTIERLTADVRRLEDAVDLLWGWMPIAEAKDDNLYDVQTGEATTFTEMFAEFEALSGSGTRTASSPIGPD